MTTVSPCAPSGRFVVLEHDFPELHWDLMLEVGDGLKTWRLPSPPAEGEVAAEAIADHRLAYLDYEGPVSGGRGFVKRCDAGTYRCDAFSAEAIEGQFFGERSSYRAAMTRLAGNMWRVRWSVHPAGSTLTTQPASEPCGSALPADSAPDRTKAPEG